MDSFRIQRVALLLAIATTSHAQFYSGNPYAGYGNGPFGGSTSNSDDNGSGNDNNDDSFGGPFGGRGDSTFASNRRTIVTAHAILGALAFAVIFPVGGILIRLATFPGSWIVHGVIQILGYIAYFIAFGLGVWMTRNLQTFHEAHPIIGIVVLLLILFQPLLGLLHHFAFRRHGRRGFFSIAHIWLGRIAITVGVVNGGLGLELAQRLRFLAPSSTNIIAYAVVAGVFWLLYLVAIFVGESRRRQSQRVVHYEHSSSDDTYDSHHRRRHSGPAARVFARPEKTRYF